MKSVLFITTSISYGGASKILCFIANSLHERGYDVNIANLKTTGKNDTYNQEIRDEISVYDISSSINDNSFLGRRFSRIQNIIKLYNLAKGKKVDVLIGFTILPNFMASLVGKLLGIPSIMSERGDPFRTFSTSHSDKFRKRIIEKCDGGVFQTDGAMGFYSDELKKKSIVIPNPIFIDHIPNNQKERSIISLGRLDNFQKRYDVMISAFKLFTERHPNIPLYIYGQGPDYEKIMKWCEEADIIEKVKFCGVTNDSLDTLSRFSIFLITSDFEGISNSLLEAMAVGLACVSTDHSPGGAKLLIQDHLNGLLVPCGDSQAIANALSEYVENNSLMESCGQEAKKVIERFSPVKIVDMWEDYINLVISK